MSIVPGHDGGHDSFVDFPDKKKGRLEIHFRLDIFVRIIPGDGQSALLPEFDHAGFIGLLVSPYGHFPITSHSSSSLIDIALWHKGFKHKAGIGSSHPGKAPKRMRSIRN
jgi:hypothetical protein